MKSFIIKAKYGGLGDNLFLSHLPRIAKEYGEYNRVLISKRSEFRHENYYKLVWELNPFVDGLTDEDAPFVEFIDIPPGMNLLDKVMLSRGLDDSKRYHEPELYYVPKLRPDLINKAVYDPNYLSYTGEIDNDKLIAFLNNENVDLQMGRRDKTFGFRENVPSIEATSVYDYCDIIYSCKRFYGLISGGATLAAAMRKPSTVLYGNGLKDMFRHSKQHAYIKV